MADDSKPMTAEEWRKIAWDDSPPDLGDDVRQVLEQYSHIPADRVIEHVTSIREKAFKIFPYPCIGKWRFLNLAIGRHPRYQEVKARLLNSDERFLDLGCAFGQDVRRLVADGVDSSRCYGSDLRQEFVDLGYDLFQDRDTLKTTFITADIFDDKSSLSQLYGKINVINSSSFFHLFSYQQQKHVAHQCIKFFSGKTGGLLLGRQVGNEEAGEYPTRSGVTLFRHNPESWQRMWAEVGEEAGVQFEIHSEFVEMAEFMGGLGSAMGREMGTKLLVFSVKLV